MMNQFRLLALGKYAGILRTLCESPIDVSGYEIGKQYHMLLMPYGEFPYGIFDLMCCRDGE